MEAKKIIITGGATRIGAAIAKSLATYDNEITIHYNKSIKPAQKLKKDLEKQGTKIHLIKADLNNLAQTQKMMKEAFKKMKGLDCLINNASIFENDNLNNFTDKSFIKHLNVNLKAPALLTQSFSRYVRNSDGIIINIIDQRIEKLTPFFFSYTLSKTALGTLTTTSAMRLAPNIRVNAVSPGPTLKNKRQSETHFKKQWKSVPLEKVVDLKNICNSVKFLVENDNITGQIINVDSGQRLAWLTPDIINSRE
jgi:NAD(P)-dependent dehydrogenase (short-subunit alcohol dehydrogenase family)|tara:strand:+ start:521 stop:1276 length:756 start_codon:yes stop_codon:yes gene_type:complete